MTQTGYTRDRGERGAERPTLAGLVEIWPSPDAAVMNDGTSPEAWEAFRARSKAKHANGNGHGMTLGAAVSLWATPNATDGEKAPHCHRLGNQSLPSQSKVWSTPSVQDGHNTAGPSQAASSSPPLNAQVLTCPSGHPDPGTLPAGGPSSPGTPNSRRRLNPNFVEYLQGLPPGWTGFGPVEISAYLSRQRSHLRSLTGD